MKRFIPCFIVCASIFGTGGLAFAEAPVATKKEKGKAVTTSKTPEKTAPVNANMVYVTMTTNVGAIKIELNREKAPITVKNFLGYVESGHFSKTIFHRVIDGFMIQGGGYDEKMKEKDTKAPIVLEAKNGLRNERGTLAMARTNDPNSATAQFFINLVNNDFLNASGGNPGYAVFGKVTEGMDVVDKIAKSKVAQFGSFEALPQKPVVIESMKLEK